MFPALIPHETERRSPSIDLLSLRLGDDDYCIDIMSVREIRGWSKPTPLPHASAFLSGVINLRGTVLPVIDLSLRLGMNQITPTGRNVIIIVSQDGVLTGLLANSVSDILTVPHTALTTTPDPDIPSDQRLISAIGVHETHLIRLLNLTAILPDPNSGEGL